jgi:hypothetical protein
MVGESVIGVMARDLLTQPRFVGGILAVVTGVVYLLSENLELVWLAQNDLPMHPRALRGDFDFGELRVGMPFQSDGARLRFGESRPEGFLETLRVCAADARVWQPVLIDPARVASRDTVIARIPRPEGFPETLRVCDDARALIGLGEGLTPSGDDFVGGWLFATHHLRSVYPNAFRWDQRAVDDLLNHARSRTNVISYTLLRDHARGQSVEPLHDWIAARLCGASSREIESHARRVRAIGSSTGKHLLAGAVAGMLLLGD